MEGAEIPEIVEIIEINFAPQGSWYLFVDEVHLTNRWNDWLKIIYDQNHDLRIAATGSASPLLVKGMSDSGLGRWHEIHLPTMSFAEYCHLRKLESVAMLPFPINERSLTPADVWQLTEQTLTLQPTFLQYLLEGGFPERCAADNPDYVDQLLYRDIFVTMLRRDLIRYLEIRKLDSFTRLYRYMIEHTSQLANISNIAKEIGNISKDTIAEYLDYFCSFGLLYKAALMDKGGSKILKAQAKYHIADPALYTIFHRDPLSDKTAAGHLVESVVFKHLVDTLKASGEEVGYLRDPRSNHKEIDVVFTLNNTAYYIEVKYQEGATPKSTDLLFKLSTNQPEGNFFYLSKNSSASGIINVEGRSRIIQMPVHTFLYWISAVKNTSASAS
jgi:predicted AAA+ superfamily ATPase